MKRLTKIFNTRSAELPDTDFVQGLKAQYDSHTAKKILATLKKMGLPPPQNTEEYMSGAEGDIIFLNRYGMVLRIEDKMRVRISEQMKESPWILKPVASIDAGEAVVTLCPGCHVGTKSEHIDFLHLHLSSSAIWFSDNHEENYGLLPVQTPRFPDGIPVVIDRGAVEQLTRSAMPISDALKEKTRDDAAFAAAEEAALYAPLRQAFNAAWPDAEKPVDAEKMQKFWDLCRSYAQAGKLIAGWNEWKNPNSDDYSAEPKTKRAVEKAQAYETLLKSPEKKTPQSAAAPAPT